MGKAVVLLAFLYLYFNVNEYLVPAFKMKRSEEAHLADLFTGGFAPLFWFAIMIGMIIPIFIMITEKGRKPLPMFVAGCMVVVVKEGDEEVITDYVITKSKITLDTVNTDGAKSITITVMQLDKNNKWLPAKDVEMKVGIARLGSILSAGDEQSYTTDANGTITAELKKDSLPGDKNGNITLIAKVEDNETLGNLVVEKTANWGVPTIEDTNFFNQRTLWTTRFRTPYWLLFMAYSIIIGVWGTLIYLIRQLLKIKKLGKTAG